MVSLIKSSPWAQLKQDEELRAEILQDVDRCMPEVAFFRRPETQRTMLDVLFVSLDRSIDVLRSSLLIYATADILQAEPGHRRSYR